MSCVYKKISLVYEAYFLYCALSYNGYHERKIAMDLSKMTFGNAAGEVKTLEQVEALAKTPITNLLVGSITVEKRDGNPGETFWVSPDDKFALNAGGLRGLGIDYYREVGPEMASIAHKSGKVLIVSIAGTQHNSDWVNLAKCAASFADGIEINISCPNKWKDGKMEVPVAENPDAVSKILRDVSKATNGNVPLSVKLPPFERPGDGDLYKKMVSMLTELSECVPTIVSTNTVGGVSTYIRSEGRQVLAMSLAGKSGPAIKPWSLLQARKLVEALPKQEVVGVGGIRAGSGALEFIQVGCSGWQVGTHFFQYGHGVFGEIISQINDADLDAFFEPNYA